VVLGKQSVAEAGKEFLNHAVGGEGHVNSCRTRIVWWSERHNLISVQSTCKTRSLSAVTHSKRSSVSCSLQITNCSYLWN